MACVLLHHFLRCGIDGQVQWIFCLRSLGLSCEPARTVRLLDQETKTGEHPPFAFGWRFDGPKSSDERTSPLPRANNVTHPVCRIDLHKTTTHPRWCAIRSSDVGDDGMRNESASCGTLALSRLLLAVPGQGTMPQSGLDGRRLPACPAPLVSANHATRFNRNCFSGESVRSFAQSFFHRSRTCPCPANWNTQQAKAAKLRTVQAKVTTQVPRSPLHSSSNLASRTG
jgi:hypothetical protein